MRFLIFNLAAVMAIGYLVFGQDIKPSALIDKVTGAQDTNASPSLADQPEQADLREKLTARLQDLENKLQDAATLPNRIAALEDDNATLKRENTLLKDRVTQMETATTPDKKPIRTHTAAPQQPRPLAHMAGSTEALIAEEQLDEDPVQEVAALPVDTGNQAQPNVTTDIPANTDATAVSPAPDTVANEPVFLSPKERRRELQLLSQDLEELYIRSLGQ